MHISAKETGYAGTVTYVVDDTAHLDAGSQQQIEHMVQQLDFFELPANVADSANDDIVADKGSHEITVSKGDQQHTVTFGDPGHSESTSRRGTTHCGGRAHADALHRAVCRKAQWHLCNHRGGSG